MGKHLLRFNKYEKQEHLLYLILWGLLFLSPVISMYIRSTGASHHAFQWAEVFEVWKRFFPFLCIFLIHNFLVAPLLVYKKKRILYYPILIVLLLLFQTYQCTRRPDIPHGPMDGRGGPPDKFIKAEKNDKTILPTDLATEGETGKPQMHRQKTNKPGAGNMGQGQRPVLAKHPDDGPPRGELPPLFFGQHDIMAFVILFLLLGTNLGMKFYFKMNHEHEILDELKNKNMEQQLEYLKYQINPHFFMNTLNNIHAMVDIDTEKAKALILELSKLMRYLLYEGANSTVPLQHEVDFLNNYLTLMRIRYTEKVKIDVDIPASVPDRNVPPLLFIPFVENAFKHGVSYQKESFIHIQLLIDDDTLSFVCRNSKIDEKDEEHGGVGLANVKKRLQLIYGDNHSLDITDDNKVFDVHLSIPLLREKQSPQVQSS